MIAFDKFKDNGKIKIEAEGQVAKKRDIWVDKIQKIEQKQKATENTNNPNSIQRLQNPIIKLNPNIPPQNSISSLPKSNPFNFTIPHPPNPNPQQPQTQQYQPISGLSLPNSTSIINNQNFNHSTGNYKQLYHHLQTDKEKLYAKQFGNYVNHTHHGTNFMQSVNGGINNNIDGNKSNQVFNNQSFMNTQNQQGMLNANSTNNSNSNNFPFPTMVNNNGNSNSFTQNNSSLSLTQNIQTLPVNNQNYPLKAQLNSFPAQTELQNMQKTNILQNFPLPQTHHNQQTALLNQQVQLFLNYFYPLLQKQLSHYKQNIADSNPQQQHPNNKCIYQRIRSFEHNKNYQNIKQQKKKKKTVEILLIQNNPQRQIYRKAKKQQFFNKMNKNLRYPQQPPNNNIDPINQNYNVTRNNKNENKIKVKKQKDFNNNHDRFNHATSINNPQVSQFTSFVKLEYVVDLRWLQQPQIVIQQYRKQTVTISQKPTYTQIYETIMMDLKKKSIHNGEDATLKMKQCYHKRSTPNILQKLFLGKKEHWTKDYYYVGSLFKKKINISKDFQYSPTCFKGFVVQDLSVWNEFGKIQWKGFTDISNIDFQKHVIKIGRYEVECTIPELQKEAIVQFVSMPKKIKKTETKKQIQKNLKLLVQRSKNTKFIQYNEISKSWKIIVNFGIKQF